MSLPWRTWDEWLGTLGSTEREAALALADRFRDLGADDPEGCARSQLSDIFPELARQLFLRSVQREAIDTWAAPHVLEGHAVAGRLIDAGADREDLLRLV